MDRMPVPATDEPKQCPYCLDALRVGPDQFCCGMQEDDYWRARQSEWQDQADRWIASQGGQ